MSCKHQSGVQALGVNGVSKVFKFMCGVVIFLLYVCVFDVKLLM